MRCAGFRLGARVVTAAHCARRPTWVDGIAAPLLAVDAKVDAAVLDARQISAHAPRLADDDRDLRVCGVALWHPADHRDGAAWATLLTFATVLTDDRAETHSAHRGPCAGDSGAPLVGCDGGTCVLLGMLTRGSPRCVGHDVYAGWAPIDELLHAHR